MEDVTLTLVDAAGAPASWSAELWTGRPGTAAATQIAGGGTPFSLADLEAPGPGGIALDKKTVLRAMREGDGPNDVFLAVGLRLYDLLDRAGVMQEWRDRRTAPGLRTYLELPPALEEWPWELLAWKDPAAIDGRDFAFTIADHPILRAQRIAIAADPWPGGVVRILLVSGQEQLDAADATAIASAELRVIREAFHKSNLSVILEFLPAPSSRTTLEASLTAFAPHVVHFIGHGDLDAARQQEFQLRFKFDKGGWEWPANEIRRFVKGLAVKPRLVVLNSCHSSRPELSAAPVATALLAAGVHAVIGAQAALRIDHARQFSRAFYGALARGEPVDRAMAAARDDLSKIDVRRRLWALPVLTAIAPIDQVLQFARVAGAVASSDEAREVFARRGRFVNRSADRWKLLSAFRPAANAPVFRGVILRSKVASVGKAWLVKRCLRDFTDAGFVVRYASLVSQGTGKTPLDVLDEWRRSLRIGPENGAPFAAFDAALSGAGRSPDAKAIVEVFDAFKAGLQNMRKGRPVLLVLERFRQDGRMSVSADEFRELLDKLFLPIRYGEDDVRDVHALLVVRQDTDLGRAKDDIAEFGLDLLSDRLDDEATRRPEENGFRRVTVEEFASEQIGPYVEEFTDFTQNARILNALTTTLSELAAGAPWTPDHFKILDPIYERFPNK
jgi:hypothetical protein